STKPVFAVKEQGKYHLTLTNNCGTFSDTINITKGLCHLYVPSAFTPNGDGLNDIFRAVMSDNSHIFLLQVFNRWGKKIFESHDILRGWDGTLNGTRQPEGNYVWVL